MLAGLWPFADLAAVLPLFALCLLLVLPYSILCLVCPPCNAFCLLLPWCCHADLCLLWASLFAPLLHLVYTFLWACLAFSLSFGLVFYAYLLYIDVQLVCLLNCPLFWLYTLGQLLHVMLISFVCACMSGQFLGSVK